MHGPRVSPLLPGASRRPTSTGLLSLAERDFWERVPRNTWPNPPLPSRRPVVYTGELETWTCVWAGRAGQGAPDGGEQAWSRVGSRGQKGGKGGR